MGTLRDTFVLVAEDCLFDKARVPQAHVGKPTIAALEYALLSQSPYTLTREDLILAVHLARLGLSEEEKREREGEIRAELLSRPHPCMRASPLTKSHGFGAYHDGEGRIALVPVESADYKAFASGQVPGVTLTKAMRSKRAA